MRFAASALLLLPLSLAVEITTLPERRALVTTTLDAGDGDTVVLSVSTDRQGDKVTETLSTILTDFTAITDPTTSTTSTTTKKKTTTTTTAKQGVQAAPTTTGPPMHTTTYYYEMPDGLYTYAIWTASFVAPTEATVVVPEGTVQDYNAYQSSVNSVVFSSAVVSEDAAAASSAGERRAVSGPGVGWGSVAGWTAMAVGVVGAGWGIIAL